MIKDSRDIMALLMLPPPLHGASLINRIMVDYLRQNGESVTVMNTVPSSYFKYFNNLIWKVLRLILVCKIFFSILLRIFHPPKVVYIGVSGGGGLMFDCILSLAIRMIRVNVVVHHHSFSYVNKYNIFFWLFCKILGSRIISHVVLCSNMGNLLVSRYSHLIISSKILIISNAAFFSPSKRIARDCASQSQIVIGYISNITAEKGVFDVLELHQRCRLSGIGAKFIVAGPCSDDFIRNKLINLDLLFDDFLYLGAVYDQEKFDFYRSIDLLVFPTKYSNEAEPLVIYEAAENAVPAIANSRGCIDTLVESCGGWSIDDDENFVSRSFEIISDLKDGDKLSIFKNKAVSGSVILHESSQIALQSLFEKLGGSYYAKT
jgi:glycosyltransferase involved in cell wall biosynthesis